MIRIQLNINVPFIISALL
ncbi:hypothetical protein Godav_010651 [Gossypium davidsonii]|uniref:Uncharacterized protein n=1 Tax=Gossypium davidsonii TaxID=34287 RepID=A0A7J8SHA2_GOSDV|nr:hypothetical protein [Gossypium davidsonii]